jgi:hypothetical protein
VGFRFRKSIRIAPGIRINVGARGISTTLGPSGASVNVGPNGTYANIGIPGTGFSSRTRLDASEHHATPMMEGFLPAAVKQGSSTWVLTLVIGIVVGVVIAAMFK